MKFILDKGNTELAAAEALALAKVKDYFLEGNVLEIDKDIKGLDKRLALTKEITIDKKNKNQKIEIPKKELMDRRAHLLPKGHPASTVPKLARAMVNLTGAEIGESVLDPFCGAGGILIEAGLMGLRVVGFDIDEVMVRRAKINLDYVGIGGYILEQKDATTISKKDSCNYLVTDLPYGKGTKLSGDLEELYLKFLKVLKKIKKERGIQSIRLKKMIIGFPDFVEHKMLVKEAGLKLENDFDWYLHKNLSKKITVIS